MLDNLSVRYRQHPALHQVTGHIAAGSLTAVVGPNGSGKSTLLRSLRDLVPAAGGRLKVQAPMRRIAYLPQHSEIDRSFPITVQDCVLLGCWSSSGAWGRVTPAGREQVAQALAQMHLQGFEQRPLGSLSAGQLQRVLLARLLTQNGALILLDEPFNAVDDRTTQALLGLLARWQQEQRTVVAVVHDDALVRQHFPCTLLLARQVVAWGDTAETLTPRNLQRARAMAEAWDERAELCHVDAALPARGRA